MNNAIDFPKERRRYPRTQLEMMLNGICLDPDGDVVVETVRMLDISKCGLGAITERSFYRGQRLMLCLPLSQGGRRKNVSATVVRCRQEPQGFHVGLEFDGVSASAWYDAEAAVAAA